MLDLLIFTQYPKAYGPVRLMKEAKNLEIRSQKLDYGNIDINRLPESKVVILREPDHNKNLYSLRDEILRHYLSTNSSVLNSKSYLKWSILDKMTQTSEFEKGNIPHIENLDLSTAKYPYIVKNKLGSHGDSVYKITNKEDLDTVLQKHKIEDLLSQEFQTSGFDIRVIVLGGKVLGIMKRTPRDGVFLSNYSQGGIVTKYEGYDTSEIGELAIKTAKHFELDYVGVDLMKGNDNTWIVLEVNRACQFQGFEKAVDVNVAQKLLQYVVRRKI